MSYKSLLKEYNLKLWDIDENYIFGFRFNDENSCSLTLEKTNRKQFSLTQIKSKKYEKILGVMQKAERAFLKTLNFLNDCKNYWKRNGKVFLIDKAPLDCLDKKTFNTIQYNFVRNNKDK